MTELVPVESIHFVNGEPLCAFQECYRCFEGRDLLYRLVNVEKKQWFFYNNTVDVIMHVHAVFSPGSVIKPLQRATLHVVPNAAGFSDDTCSTEVTLDVEPGYTESFIEGDVKGFNFEFRTEAAPAKDVAFEYRRPTEPYDKIYKCFKNNGNGLLFRLVDDKASRWLFYNDTRDFMMKVSVVFANGAEVRPLGKTAVTGAPPESGEKSISCVLHIAPGATESFIEGHPVTYTLDFAAEPVVPPALPKTAEEPVEYVHGGPDARVMPHQSHVYKCFKDHGNGLLFRIVDDYNNIWAFYNDTAEYVMTANMRFPHSSSVQVAPGVQVIADTEREGGVVAAVEVPPLATVPFLVGTPATYELAFSATPVQSPPLTPSPSTSAAPSTGDFPRTEAVRDASASSSPPPLATTVLPAVPAAAAAAAQPLPAVPVPEELPMYAHGHPDPTIMPHIDEVYKCFKEHGNGLLFRLVDKTHHRWAFYNDTTDVVASVKVAFHPRARIELLGKAEAATEPETGTVVYTLRVEPLETAVFVQGDVDVFTTSFMAEHIQV
ncbi:hypothetical protein ABB37_03181 [Leptomonas pyrrhocoris]|uniref:DUF1935 domain-containing protein n=1 Tax=Leptomonas pyrrhocoris TaxID=157538 RepID=A0A0N0VFS6_LEPPY|nr:hypothetical protein ABB37_03181 [Leptomonas pyrrhocoris]KPA82004.1 hypothetical protein ABB37_03181 [Leptomonas pyrrhocoris]|eukprot:XP_015660443.1 hypothetical protein ABB37_03181 [Leptomonas pyrrhocoris]